MQVQKKTHYAKEELNYYRLYHAEKEESLKYHKSLIQADAQIDLQKAKSFTLETSNATLKNKLKKQTVEFGHKKRENEVQLLKLQNEHTALKHEANLSWTNQKELEGKVRVLESINGELKKQLTNANKKIESCEKTAEEAQEQAEQIEHDLRGKLSDTEEQMDDFERKYKAENTRRQESEKTMIEMRHSLDTLKYMLKNTQVGHLKEIEADDAKYQMALKDKHAEHIKLTGAIHTLQHKLKEIEFKSKSKVESYQKQNEVLKQGKHVLNMEIDAFQIKYRKSMKEKDAKIHELTIKLKESQRSLKDITSSLHMKSEMFAKKIEQLSRINSVLETEKKDLNLNLQEYITKLKEKTSNHQELMKKNLNLHDQIQMKSDQVINKNSALEIALKETQKLQVEFHEKVHALETMTRRHDEVQMAHEQHQDELIRIHDRYEHDLDDVKELLRIEQDMNKELQVKTNEQMEQLENKNEALRGETKRFEMCQLEKEALEMKLKSYIGLNVELEQKKLNNELHNKKMEVDVLKQKFTAINGDNQILKMALSKEKDKLQEISENFKKQTSKLRAEHETLIVVLEKKLKAKRMDLIKETFKRNGAANRIKRLQAEIKILKAENATEASKNTAILGDFEEKKRKLENRVLAFHSKFRSLKEVHSMLVNIALMNEEDKISIAQRHLGEMTNLKIKLTSQEKIAGDLRSKILQLIGDRLHRYKKKTNEGQINTLIDPETSNIEECVNTLEILLREKENKVRDLNNALKTQEQKYQDRIRDLNVYHEIKIKQTLEEVSTSEKHIIATEQYLQNEMHDFLYKTHNFHAAKYSKIEDKYSKMEEKLNDETKIIVDKIAYEKEKEESEATRIKLESAEQKLKIMQEEIDGFHHEIRTYSPIKSEST
jgi:hypothetical protein